MHIFQLIIYNNILRMQHERAPGVPHRETAALEGAIVPCHALTMSMIEMQQDVHHAGAGNFQWPNNI